MSPDPPKILFILTNNQRADLLGFEGNPIIQTPNIDLLARRSIHEHLRHNSDLCDQPCQLYDRVV